MTLIDTHVLLWSLYDYKKLSEDAITRIKDDDAVYVSIVSLWEIAIKQSIGKLQLDVSIDELASKCKDAGIDILPISLKHIEQIKDLPDIHKDPFDRMIVAQAMTENLTIVTHDAFIPKYDVSVVW